MNVVVLAVDVAAEHRHALGRTRAGQAVGVKEVDSGIWLVSFMDYDLGYIDLEERTLPPLENPFGPKMLPKCVRNTLLPMCPVRTNRTFRRHGLHFFAWKGAEERDAMEGELCYGRTHAFCDPAQGWGKHGFVVPGVRDLPEDWL